MYLYAIIEIAQPWMTGVFAAGVAWGGVKMGLNGQKEKLDKVSRDLADHLNTYAEDREEVVRTLTRVETKVDLLIDHKIKDG